MSKTNANYNQLISKLDEFIRKYYINQFIRGALYTTALLVGLFLVYVLMEHLFYFSSTVRKFLFFSWLGIAGLSLFGWVFKPLLNYFSLGKIISHKEAAQIIGTHFHEVKDKLTNILQLKEQADKDASALVLAGIDQKTVELNPVPFKSAIDLSANRKYFKYALPPLLLMLLIFLAAPSIITDSTERIIQNNREFERPAPFQFEVVNTELSAMQFDNFELEVKAVGDVQPAEVYIDKSGIQYRMRKNSEGNFTYRINNIQSDLSFSLVSGPVRSKSYQIEVIRKPRMVDMVIDMDFPSYTGRSSSTLTNIGDVTVPQGTEINFTFYTESTQSVELVFGGEEEPIEAEQRRPQHFEYSRVLMSSKPYKLYVSGEGLSRVDSVGFTINVIPDRYPIISVEEFQDKDDEKLRFFAGEAADDYGLREISFHYQIIREGGREEPMEKILIDNPGKQNATFVYNWDIQPLGLKAGDQVSYFFEAADNDAINGSKRSRTGLMTYRIMSLEEMREIAQENTESIKENLDESVSESSQLQEEIRQMQEKLLNQENMDWQDRRDLEQLLDKKEELQKMVDEAREKMRENLQNEENHMDMDPEIAEKQQRLQELFDQMADDEMKSIMDQIRDLLDELTREEAIDMLRDMEISEQRMEQNLDRMKELFNSLQVEKQMAEARQKLEELAEQLDELSEETRSGEGDQEDLLNQQQEITDAFEQLKEDLEKLRQDNQNLERPHNLGNQEQLEEQISNDLNESSDQLQDGDNEGASDSQEGAGEKMREMAQGMQSSMQGGQMAQMQEDMESLRKLLDNLISISYDQEDLVIDFNRTSINTPRYIELMREQFKINNDFKVVEDSLVALSKRVLQLETFIMDKVSDIKRHMGRSVEHLEERQKNQASDDQRRVMTYVNDLALMLSETMEQMQQQMADMMPGSQMCQNPGEGESGEGEVPVDKITEGQEGIGEEMKRMQDGQGQGEEGSAEEFARMAQEQAALRRMMEQLRQQRGEQGLGTEELQEIIDKMNEIEKDLVNRRLNSELLERQQDIITRLLRAEQADRQRELDDKRRGEVARERSREFPPELEEYLRQREAEINFYRSVSPGLSPYYQSLVDEYYRSLRSN
ncbi:MAG: DUF4175 family protein [Saprospirales bacterium]|nr:MAG: DUF4175 family protein [Saprospirales bacterium]